MVDPRLYRAALAVVAIALIVFGFSLRDQPDAASTTLAAPPAPATGDAYDVMTSLARAFPDRLPGSPDDNRLAATVAAGLRQAGGFSVTRSAFSGRTALGRRYLDVVTATRAGLAPGTIVVLSHRDAAGRPSVADLSGTAVLLGLARAVAGQTENHTLMLVSTSGSIGAAGAAHLAADLGGQPVDAVIVLGDLAARYPTEPVVVPWSSSDRISPPELRQTVGAFVRADTGLPAGSTNLAAQFARLGVPLALGEQGPLLQAGIPAVLLSLSGNRDPSPREPVSQAHIDGLQNAVLQTLSALDGGRPIPAPEAYLTLSGNIVPGWAVRVLVLALILPVAVAIVDALARARRRGHSIIRWLAWALAGAAPFVVGLIALLVASVIGGLPATPPGPVAGGVGITVDGALVMASVVILVVGSFFSVRPLLIHLAARLGSPPGGRAASTSPGDAAAVGVMVVACAAALVLWALNPFAAALAVPALHLWLWNCQPGVRAHRGASVLLAVLGLLPAALVAVYYMHVLGVSPLGLAWTVTLAVAGGALPLGPLVMWCLLLGCAASALVVVLRFRVAAAAPAAITVRGPATYAGPGSLGGTESALGPRR